MVSTYCQAIFDQTPFMQTLGARLLKADVLRPATGDKLLAKAKVLRCGKTIAVVECDVFCISDKGSVQTAKMMATISILKA